MKTRAVCSIAAGPCGSKLSAGKVRAQLTSRSRERQAMRGTRFASVGVVRAGTLILLLVTGAACQLGCAARIPPVTARVVEADARPLTSAARGARDPFKKIREALDTARGTRSTAGGTDRAVDASAAVPLGGVGTKTGATDDAAAIGTSGVPPGEHRELPAGQSPSMTPAVTEEVTSHGQATGWAVWMGAGVIALLAAAYLLRRHA